MIHLIGNLYSVEVPNNNIKYKIEVLSENDEFEEETMLIFDTLDFLRLTQGKYKILGEVIADWISFYTEHYVEKEYIEVSDTHSLNGYIEGIGFKDYNDEDNLFESSIESFYSLLQSKGIYFEHCCGNFIDDGVVGETCCQKPNGIKGKLIILEKL